MTYPERVRAVDLASLLLPDGWALEPLPHRDEIILRADGRTVAEFQADTLPEYRDGQPDRTALGITRVVQGLISFGEAFPAPE